MLDFTFRDAGSWSVDWIILSHSVKLCRTGLRWSMQSKIFVLFLFVVAFAHGILTGSSPHRVTLAHGLCNLRFLLVVMLGHCLLQLLCLLARPLVGGSILGVACPGSICFLARPLVGWYRAFCSRGHRLWRLVSLEGRPRFVRGIRLLRLWMVVLRLRLFEIVSVSFACLCGPSCAVRLPLGSFGPYIVPDLAVGGFCLS